MSTPSPTSAPGAPPGFRPPAGACDGHAHVFGSGRRFPLVVSPEYESPDAPLEAYLALLDRLGLARGVVVQASVYGTDNSALEDALVRAGGRLRGIVVIDADTDRSVLARLEGAGVCGVRVTARRMPSLSRAALEPLAHRIAPFGWHLQLLIDPPHLLALADDLPRLPVSVVIDHIARMWLAAAHVDATLDALRRLLATGRVWVKISNAHKLAVGPPYEPALPVVRALVAANPERIIWGTDWPHPSEAAHPPDDAALLELFAHAVPDAARRTRILVDNPQQLYGFETAAREA